MWVTQYLVLTFATQVFGLRIQIQVGSSYALVTSNAIITKEGCQGCLEDESDPVCGTDGVTYFNLCEFNCTQAQSHSETLEVLHEGLCSALGQHNETEVTITADPVPIMEIDGTNTLPQTDCDPFQNCSCNYELLPTCGSDFQTYPNKCALQCAVQCDPDLHVYHDGPCRKNIDPLPQKRRSKI